MSNQNLRLLLELRLQFLELLGILEHLELQLQSHPEHLETPCFLEYLVDRLIQKHLENLVGLCFLVHRPDPELRFLVDPGNLEDPENHWTPVGLEHQENPGVLLGPSFLFLQFLDDLQILGILRLLENHLLLESLEDRVHLERR
jgi:hypothetical protein